MLLSYFVRWVRGADDLNKLQIIILLLAVFPFPYTLKASNALVTPLELWVSMCDDNCLPSGNLLACQSIYTLKRKRVKNLLLFWNLLNISNYQIYPFNTFYQPFYQYLNQQIFPTQLWRDYLCISETQKPMSFKF